MKYVRKERQILYDITYMWKYNTNEHIYEIETDSQRVNCGCQGGRAEGRIGSLGSADTN